MKGEHDTITTILQIAALLFQGAEVTSQGITRRFAVSRATAKRYLIRLELALPVIVEEVPTGKRGAGRARKVMRLMAPAGHAGSLGARARS